MMYDMKERINARVDAELARKIEQVQYRTGKSLTAMVQESLAAYCAAALEEPRSAYDALTASGFIGGAEGDEDLSENYKALMTRSLRKKT